MSKNPVLNNVINEKTGGFHPEQTVPRNNLKQSVGASQGLLQNDVDYFENGSKLASGSPLATDSLLRLRLPTVHFKLSNPRYFYVSSY